MLHLCSTGEHALYIARIHFEECCVLEEYVSNSHGYIQGQLTVRIRFVHG